MAAATWSTASAEPVSPLPTARYPSHSSIFLVLLLCVLMFGLCFALSVVCCGGSVWRRLVSRIQLLLCGVHARTSTAAVSATAVSLVGRHRLFHRSGVLPITTLELLHIDRLFDEDEDEEEDEEEEEEVEEDAEPGPQFTAVTCAYLPPPYAECVSTTPPTPSAPPPSYETAVAQLGSSRAAADSV